MNAFLPLQDASSCCKFILVIFEMHLTNYFQWLFLLNVPISHNFASTFIFWFLLLIEGVNLCSNFLGYIQFTSLEVMLFSPLLSMALDLKLQICLFLFCLLFLMDKKRWASNFLCCVELTSINCFFFYWSGWNREPE